MSDDLDRQIVIRVFRTHTEAELVQSLLESAGIPAWVATDDAGGVYPGLDGARVMIRARDQNEAETLLAANEPPQQT
jgi:hypothetical protein